MALPEKSLESADEYGMGRLLRDVIGHWYCTVVVAAACATGNAAGLGLGF